MADIRVTISGPDLAAIIRQTNKHIEAAAEKALDDVVKATIDDAKATVPVRTGKLKKSIRQLRKEKLLRVVGTDVSYAPFIEFGTYKMHSRPFLFPAFEKNRQKLIAALRTIRV